MVDRADIDQMAHFMSVLGNDPAALTAGADKSPRTRIAPAQVISTDSVQEMKAILERFHEATSNLIAESDYDRPLREALMSEQTDSGVRFGNWEIVVSKHGKHNRYDVMHASGDKIATDLYLYEAAYGLVRLLNEGIKINSREVLDLLKAEQDYAGAVHDMVLYKHHMKNTPDSPRMPVYEARYGAAKRLAAAAKKRVENLSESL